MIIKVCVGSSCHLKGSYDVIESLKSLLNHHQLENDVELEASFCLGHCAKGVSVAAEELGDVKVVENEHVSATAEGLMLHHVSKDNIEAIFSREILPLIKK